MGQHLLWVETSELSPRRGSKVSQQLASVIYGFLEKYRLFHHSEQVPAIHLCSRLGTVKLGARQSFSFKSQLFAVNLGA